jgi:hypothetical protein
VRVILIFKEVIHNHRADIWIQVLELHIHFKPDRCDIQIDMMR